MPKLVLPSRTSTFFVQKTGGIFGEIPPSLEGSAVLHLQKMG